MPPKSQTNRRACLGPFAMTMPGFWSTFGGGLTHPPRISASRVFEGPSLGQALDPRHADDGNLRESGRMISRSGRDARPCDGGATATSTIAEAPAAKREPAAGPAQRWYPRCTSRGRRPRRHAILNLTTKWSPECGLIGCPTRFGMSTVGTCALRVGTCPRALVWRCFRPRLRGA